MINVSSLPTLNALLNFVALILLVWGYLQIRAKRVKAHKRLMVSAFMVSILFLASYVTYRTLGEEKRFTGQGLVRPIYFFILITHVTLAATVPFLAARTLYLGLRGRINAHRRIARITLPIWIYVSVTGVLVYFFLFQFFPPAPSGG